jgi:serine/threonine protein kinase
MQRLSENIEINFNDILGSGAMGKVYRGFSSLTKQPIAIKVVTFDKNNENFEEIKEAFDKECLILNKIAEFKTNNSNHKGVKNIIFSLETSYNLSENVGLLAFEQAEGSLDKLKFTQAINFKFVKQIINGIRFLHDEFGIIHADIKPANILVFSNEDQGKKYIKITDFGLSFTISDFPRKPRGSIAYSPVEINVDKKVNNFSSDIYSLSGVAWKNRQKWLILINLMR